MDFSLIKPIIDLVKPAGEELTKAAIKRRGETKDSVVAALHEKFATVIRDADPSALAQRMIARQEYLTLRKQLNYENVMELALEMALETSSDSRRTVEEDWFAQWFSAVEDVSDSVMQELWAKAFAHQTNNEQRKISLRALDSLRLMERRDVQGFQRAVDLFSFFGYIFAASQEIIDCMMSREILNGLIDLGLVIVEETMVRSVAISGGYMVRLNTDSGQYVADPIKVFKLSPRGVELAPTIPSKIEELEQADYEFDMTDRLCVSRYINMIGRGLGDMFSITLCVYDRPGERPPKGGRKRTHIWDSTSESWIRKETLDFEYNREVVEALESGSV
ncbi:DUF2806 domain-containing protein [Puniceicoccaceae bacterium K14]|nr:DUF2806 domain-containing protein [Puniceicoccaceae bacterium K14]